MYCRYSNKDFYMCNATLAWVYYKRRGKVEMTDLYKTSVKKSCIYYLSHSIFFSQGISNKVQPKMVQ